MTTNGSSSSAKWKAADRSPSPDQRTKPSSKSRAESPPRKKAKDFSLWDCGGLGTNVWDSEDSDIVVNYPGMADPPPTSGPSATDTAPESGPSTVNLVPRGRRGKGKVNRLDIAPTMAVDSASPPVPSLPMAVTGVLPRPLGKTSAHTAPRQQVWYQTCDLKDTRFLELLQQAEATPPAKWMLAQHMVVNCKECHNRRGMQPLAFAIDASLPSDVKGWIAQWAKNPVSVPRPVCEDMDGRLNLVDIDVWAWSKAITPKSQKEPFTTVLWDIFQTPGRWHTLVNEIRWPDPKCHLRDKMTTWVWAPEATEVSPKFVAQWLGRYAGVMKEWAQAWIEPYTARRATGAYHSPIAQRASDRIRMQGGRGPPAGEGGSGTTLTTTTPAPNPVGLTARLSGAPAPSAQTRLDDSNTVVADGQGPIVGPEEPTVSAGVTMPAPTPVGLAAQLSEAPMPGAQNPTYDGGPIMASNLLLATKVAASLPTSTPTEIDVVPVPDPTADMGTDTSDIYQD